MTPHRNKGHMRKVFELTEIPFGVTVEQRGKNGSFRVTYGKQVKSNLSYADAAREFGECVFHALACDGKLGNDQKD